MNVRLRDLTGAAAAVGLAALTGLATWYFTRPASKPPAAAPTPPAAVSLKEAELLVITLTPEAEERLGIRLASAERRAVPLVRTYGGEVTVPAGHALTVPAPLSGTVKAPQGGPPRAGQPVKKDQAIFLFTPLLTPDARANLAASLVDAEGQVRTAQASIDAASVALKRAQELYRQEAGSKRAVDETQAQLDLAQKTLEAAQARRALLARVAGETESGSMHALAITAPVDGVLRNVQAAVGEAVPAGAALFEVVDLATVWVRVPVYVGDAAEIDPETSAAVGSITVRAGATPWQARPTPAPPSANAQASTVDRYYELDNRKARFAPGQRVGVTLALKGEQESLVVPWSAVIHDIHGGTWVYEQTEPRKYVRRRVLVRHIVGGLAVLAEGPKPGTQVVAEGAAELFGVEVGFAK